LFFLVLLTLLLLVPVVQVLQEEVMVIDQLVQTGQTLHFQHSLLLVVAVVHHIGHQALFQPTLEVQVVEGQHLMDHNLLEALELPVKVMQEVMVVHQVVLNIMLLVVAVRVQLVLLQQMQATLEQEVLVFNLQ
jgi:hypothetical protein